MRNIKCWRLPIVPGRRQPSIFGTSELNFRVRNGNGWTLTVINTNYLSLFYFSSFGDPWGNRTPVIGVRGRCLNRLTNGPFLPPAQRPEPFPTPGPTSFFGAPSGALPPAGQHATGILPSRPFLAARLSGPLLSEKIVYHFFFGAPSGARTRDTLIKSQVLYQLS